MCVCMSEGHSGNEERSDLLFFLFCDQFVVSWQLQNIQCTHVHAYSSKIIQHNLYVDVDKENVKQLSEVFLSVISVSTRDAQ